METNSARRAMYRCSLASTRSNNSLSLALMAEAGGWDLVVFGRLRDLGGTKGRAAGCVSGADRFDILVVVLLARIEILVMGSGDEVSAI